MVECLLEWSLQLLLRGTLPHNTAQELVQSLASLQIPEKSEASDRERPFCDTASKDWPSQPSEGQKLTLSTTVTRSTSILQDSMKSQTLQHPTWILYVEVAHLYNPVLPLCSHCNNIQTHEVHVQLISNTHVNCIKAMHFLEVTRYLHIRKNCFTVSISWKLIGANKKPRKTQTHPVKISRPYKS